MRLLSSTRRPVRAWVAGACALAAACAAGESPVESRGGPHVRFVAPVDVAQFSPGSLLRVRVWNGEKLAALDQNARCASVHDPATGRTEHQCPPGITYQEVTPEEFRIDVSGSGGTLSVRSETVRVGERFRVLLAGTSADGCNQTSAERTDEATSAEVVLGDLSWETTARGCVNP